MRSTSPVLKLRTSQPRHRVLPAVLITLSVLLLAAATHEGANAAPSTPTRLTANPARDSDPNPSPDGSKIAFLSNRDVCSGCDQGTNNLFVMDADGQNVRDLTCDQHFGGACAGQYELFSNDWSPDNSTIVFQRGVQSGGPGCGFGEFAHVWTVDIATGVERDLTTDPCEYDSTPKFSPDGTQIYFSRFANEPGGTHAITVMNVDGSNRHDVVTFNDATLPWDISADGSTIAYACVGACDGGIHVLNSDGTNDHAVTTSPYDGSPVVSPDGTKIAFTRQLVPPDGNGEQVLMVVSSDGTGLQQLSQAGASTAPVQWTADGQRILVDAYSPDGSSAAVQLVAADGSGSTDLTPESSQVGQGSHLSTDGNELFTTGDFAEPGNVDLYRFDIGAPPPPPPPPADLVTRNGTQLVRNGQPFRPIGLNIYNANSSGSCWYNLATGSTLDDSLSAIGAGANVIRAWFFQDLATTNGQRDWSAFDHTLAVAKAHGDKVIATLANQWADCEPQAGYKTESWYSDGYKQPDPGGTVSYRAWAQEVAARYKDDATVMAWQLVNEPEILPQQGGDCATVPESTAVNVLTAFAADVSGAIKSVDPNHLISLGTIGGGQCGAQGADYETVMNVPTLDLCEYHDYTPGQPVPGDQFNGLQVRINQCNQLQKPILVGELGVKAVDVGGTLAARANTVASKLCAQLTGGVAGVLLWAWDKDGSLLDNYDIGPNDPVLGVLSPWSDPSHTCSAPTAPSGAIAAGGDGAASISWAAPASDGGAPITSYTVTASPGGQMATTGGQTTAVVNGLTNGIAYTFTVTATNAAGTSSASAATGAVTPKPGNTAATGVAPISSATTVAAGSDPATSGGLTTSVIVPAGTSGGGVAITQTATNQTAPAGYVFGNVQADITAPAGTATNPVTLQFTLSPPSGLAPPPDPDTLAATEIFRADTGAPVLVPDCPLAGQALPDGSPCVAGRQYAGSNMRVTVLTASASHWMSARPKPGAVVVSDSGYSPAGVSVLPGANVNWTWSGKKAHTVTETAGLGPSGQPWFNSGAKTGSGSFRFTFPAAGTFAYHSTAKGDTATGSVAVPVVITPASGPTSRTFSAIWSTRALSGYTFTVQYRFKPTGSSKWTSWTTWQNAVSSTSARFTPGQGAGTYDFHALLRNTGSGRVSTYSPDTMLTVS